MQCSPSRYASLTHSIWVRAGGEGVGKERMTCEVGGSGKLPITFVQEPKHRLSFQLPLPTVRLAEVLRQSVH